VNSIRTIGILAHPHRAASIPIARRLKDQTAARGVRVWLREIWSDADVKEQVHETDLLVAIGGDGAMLQAARLGAPFGVPVMGLNLGYLGFLTESDPEDWEACLERILKGDYWVEERLMITGQVWQDDVCIAEEDALNDVVVSRGAEARTVHLEAYIDGGWATSYHADGLVIATATGSTAYALALGGPILPPELDNIMIVPIAPHFSMERSVVLSKGAAVRIVVAPRTRTLPVVTIDGQNAIQLAVGDEIHVKASQNRSSFIRLQERTYFFRSLMDRMEPRFLPRQPHEDEGSQP
jgi:NAD+ kinase